MKKQQEDFSHEQYIQMISSEWPTIAPMAYSEFLKSGRGAIYIDFRGVVAGMGTINIVTAYAPLTNLQHLASRIDSATKDLLSTYDPESTVVFLVDRRSGVLSTMFLSAGPMLKGPRELYDEQQKRPVH